MTNRRAIPNSASDGDGDSHSDDEPKSRARTGLSSKDAQRDDVCESNPSADGQGRGYTFALRSLQCGVWKLRAEQVRTNLGPSILLDDDFLLGLDKLSEVSKVSWKEALAILKQVQKERKEEEENTAVISMDWTLSSEDLSAALERIAVKQMERTDFSTDTSPVSSLTPTPEVQSPQPTGDPPPTSSIFGRPAPIPTAEPRKTNTNEEHVLDRTNQLRNTFPEASHRPRNIIAGVLSDNDQGIIPGSAKSQRPSLQSARVASDNAKSDNSHSKATEVISLDGTESEDCEDSNAGLSTNSVPAPTLWSPPIFPSNPSSQPNESTPQTRQAILGPHGLEFMASIGAFFGHAGHTESILQSLLSPNPKETGPRGGNARVRAESRDRSNKPTTSDPKSYSTLKFDVQSHTFSAAVPQSSKSLAKTDKGATPTQITTLDTTTTVNSPATAVAERSGIPIAQTVPLLASAARTIIVRLPPSVVPVAQSAPVVTNAGNKRNAESAGLSSNGGPESRRRKTGAPKVSARAEVIDLLDSDDEFEFEMPEAQLLPGHKETPITID